MIDDGRHSQTPIDIGNDDTSLVTLDVVSSRFIAAGLPRSMRTLQRYCASGTLECIKEATETGDTYFVAERSIDTAIIALKQLHDAKDGPRHAATERAVSVPIGPDHAAHDEGDIDGHGPSMSDHDAHHSLPRPASSAVDMSGHVAHLAARLDEKDEEIAFLREELIDRRGQIRDMKGIIDGQNQLLETIQTNVAPIFNALAATVKSKGIGLGPEPTSDNRQATDVEQISDHHQQGGEAPAQ